MSDQNQSTLEAATVYLFPQHQIMLEEARLKLRRLGLKVSKSQLVRLAIELLAQQPLEHFTQRLQADETV